MVNFRSKTACLTQLTRINTYQSATLTYVLFFFVLTFPYWGLGEVISPHRQLLELGITDTTVSLKLENRKFTDFTHVYIPEVATHLNGPRSSWLALWTNKNELGRPVYQTSGFSPAYLPSLIIAQLTDNPWRFITTLSLLTCFFTGIFVIGFCREIAIHPLASLIAGSSLAACPFFMYWLTFPMFPAVWCWASSALWGVTRIARKPNLASWSILSFSVYSLLMTAYPQPVVFHAYILTGYGIYLTKQKLQEGFLSTMQFLWLSLSAVTIGVALALPVYIDLINLSSESARVAADPLFFTAVLPKFGALIDVIRFCVLSLTPELFGNPVDAHFPFTYDGLSITPLVLFFVLLALLLSYRHTWGWWLVIMILCTISFVQPIYIWGIKYLGFNLSRSNPLASTGLPLTILVAYGADALIKRSAFVNITRAVHISSTGVLAVIVCGVAFGLYQQAPIRWSTALAMIALVVLLAAQHRATNPILLITAVITTLATISYPLMLHQNPSQIVTNSSLIEKIRGNLPEGSRFASVAPGLPELPPNLNAGLSLASVHSYNSLSSRRYHALIKELGGDVQTYGRWNAMISPDYNGATFWMSNISLILSPTRLVHENLNYLGEESNVHLYKVVSRMGDNLQIGIDGTDMSANGVQVLDPRPLKKYTSSKLIDQGDFLEFEVSSIAPSYLILSQKFHRDWHAQVLDQSGWIPAEVTVVNDVFQGVQLPQHAKRVRLEFKPYTRYSWVAHAFWLFLLVLQGINAWRQKGHTFDLEASIT